MALNQTNKEVMTVYFATIKADALLKEAYEAIKTNMEGPPHSPGLVVVDAAGKYAGLFTVDDLMKELGQLYRHACDEPGKQDWGAKFFSQCELLGLKKVGDLMAAKHLSIAGDDSFEKACELILAHQLHLLAVVDKNSKPVGIITRRKVLVEIGPRMFK